LLLLVNICNFGAYKNVLPFLYFNNMILNLSNFIHSLLLENETVIIPGFGAFLSTYKSAEISGTEITPPSKEISFTQQIKNNDGMLVEIIARKAKISQINALKRVEKARENMFYELDKGETIILENIGKLFYNEDNDIQFISFQQDNLLLDSFGLETISTEDLVEKTSETEMTAVLVEETGETIVITDVQNEDLPEPDKEIETENEKKKESFKFPEFQPPPKHEEPEVRRKIAWYWFLLILIPIFIGGYFVIKTNKKSNKTEIQITQDIYIEPHENQAEPIAQPDSIQNDSPIVTEIDPTMNLLPESVLSSKTSKYYLVNGGFELEENAEKYIVELKKKGIEGFIFGKTGKLFLVGIESFDTEEEAIKSLNEHFKADPKQKLWIYKNKRLK